MLQNDQLVNLQLKSAEIIKSVGKYIVDNFYSRLHISYKDSRDLLTDIDVEVENRLRDQLHKLFPEAGFILEEGENTLKSTYNWTIDPIDQTKNYATKLPVFFTQIALLENNQPILGHIYQPLSDQLFSASKDNGATLNSEKIFCNEERYIKEAIIDLDLADNTSLSFKTSLISKILSQAYRLRMSPAFSIYITTDSIDGFIGIYKDDKYVDLAPRLIVIKECGFVTEFFELKNLKFFISANRNIFPVLKKVLEECQADLVE